MWIPLKWLWKESCGELL